jgi:hypothetical protein
MRIELKRSWVVPLLATAGGALLCMFLLKEDFHLLAAIREAAGGSADFYMVVSYVVCLPGWAFLGGLLAALVSFRAGAPRRWLGFVVLTSPGVYVVLAYALFPGLGGEFHPLRDWVWAAIFIAASYVGTTIGCVIGRRSAPAAQH